MLMGQSHHDQNDGYRVDHVQNRHRDGENGVQTLVAHQEGECRDAKGELTIADFGEQRGEILGDGSDQTHTSGQAGKGEDGGQEQGAGLSEQLLHDAAECPGTVILQSVDGRAFHAHEREHGVDQGQDHPGGNAGLHSVAHDIFFLLHLQGAQGGGDDQTEIQCGDGIHGVIAFQESGDQSVVLVSGLGRGHLRLSAEQEGEKQEGQERQQTGGQEFADAVHQFVGGQRQPSGQQEKGQRVQKHEYAQRGAFRQVGGNGHLKGDRGGAGDAQAGADGQIDQHGKDHCKFGTDFSGQSVQTVEFSDHDDAHHRQDDGGDQKSQQRQRGLISGALTQKGRENQVSGAEEQGEQHKADQQLFAFCEFHDEVPPK